MVLLLPSIVVVIIAIFYCTHSCRHTSAFVAVMFITILLHYFIVTVIVVAAGGMYAPLLPPLTAAVANFCFSLWPPIVCNASGAWRRRRRRYGDVEEDETTTIYKNKNRCNDCAVNSSLLDFAHTFGCGNTHSLIHTRWHNHAISSAVRVRVCVRVLFINFLCGHHWSALIVARARSQVGS